MRTTLASPWRANESGGWLISSLWAGCDNLTCLLWWECLLGSLSTSE